MATLSFQQVDVFASRPLKGNPLAVVIAADDISEQTMAMLANWTNAPHAWRHNLPVVDGRRARLALAMATQ